MGSFSRAGSASGKAPCVACCRADRAKDDELSKASTARIGALTSGRVPPNAATAPPATQGAPSGRVNSDCAQQARVLGPVIARFDRYREALPSARAAADLN